MKLSFVNKFKNIIEKILTIAMTLFTIYSIFIVVPRSSKEDQSEWLLIII